MKNANIQEIAFNLYKLNVQYMDHQKFRKQVKQRIWAVCSRWCWDSKGNFDKAATSKMATDVLKSNFQEDSIIMKLCDSFIGPYENVLSIEKSIKKDMEKLAHQLPESDWVLEQNGFGIFNFARIIGSLGRDGRYLTGFEKPTKFWSFFGMNVIGGSPEGGGIAPKIRSGIKLGFDPERRAVVFNLGESLIKNGTDWKLLYNKAKQREVEKAKANGIKVIPAAEISSRKKDKNGNFTETEKDYKERVSHLMSKGHVHNRARRYMVKKAMKELWIEANPDKDL